MLKTLLSDLHAITNDFCDLVLGQMPQEVTEFRGEMLEVVSDDPILLDDYVEKKVLSLAHKSIALLGFEAARFQAQKKEGTTLIVMPTENALQLLFAAAELLLSNAVDIIVIHEILLKSDAHELVLEELRKLHRLVNNTNSQLVLLNPNTTERKKMRLS